MIEVEIPNNIAEYKPKMMFGLTGKQVGWAALTAVSLFLDFKFLKPILEGALGMSLGGTLSIALAFIPAALAACFGWGENFTPGNIPFEKYMKSVFVQSLLAPRVRKAKTKTTIIVPCDKNYKPLADSAYTPEVIECVTYVREHLGIEVEDPVAKKTKKKPKYKKSKEAML